MRGSLLGDDSLMHTQYLSIRSLFSFDIPDHQTDILTCKLYLWIPDSSQGIFCCIERGTTMQVPYNTKLLCVLN